jgi:transcriptional pleiotropic regulator of transition state genes
MKSTGIVRKIDDLGRMVIPIELRKTMNINKKDPMEIFVEEDKIILKKYEPACIFCGSADDTFEYKGRTICSECMDKMNEEVDK